MTVQLQKGLPAAVTANIALQHLRELHYEKCGLAKLPTATTFAQKSASPMDQLLAFSTLVQWLLQQLGGSLQSFTEFDEPNSISLEIIQNCKQFVQLDNVAPHELRGGSGDTVCQILLALTEAVLQKNQPLKAQWKLSDSNQVQGKMTEDDSEEEANMEEAFDDGMMNTFNSGGAQADKNSFALQQIAPGVSDVHLWQEECNAMEPQLGAAKFQLQVDWRPDIAKLSNLSSSLGQSTNMISQQLQVVSNQLEKQMERLQQREQFLNQQISQFSGQLIEQSRKHASLQKEAEEITKDIEMLTEQLQDATEKCKVAKNDMSYETSRINDSSAVTYTKQAIAQLSSEIRDIDLKIVLAQQRLFQFEQK